MASTSKDSDLVEKETFVPKKSLVLSDNGTDPLEVANSSEFRLKDVKTRRKYVKSWLDFCRVKNVSKGNPPTGDDFFTYIEERVKEGAATSTIRSLYSHLNSAVEVIYGCKLSIFPGLYKLVKASEKSCLLPTKAKVFDQEELDTFFRTVDLTNKYNLVRAAYAVIAYFGANRTRELKALQFKGNLTFVPGI